MLGNDNDRNHETCGLALLDLEIKCLNCCFSCKNGVGLWPVLGNKIASWLVSEIRLSGIRKSSFGFGVFLVGFDGFKFC